MTTPKDKLIAHLIDLIQRPTAKFSKISVGSIGLCGVINDRAELDDGVTLERPIYGDETPSCPSDGITIAIKGSSLHLRSRDLALHWGQANDAAERRRMEELERQREALENKQAEAMLAALGVQ